MKTHALRLASAAASCLVALGCQTVTLTASNSVVPVLLGPTHVVGGGELPKGSWALSSSQTDSFVGGSSTTQSGNVQTTTTTSEFATSAPSQLDMDVALGSGGSLERGFLLEEVDCDVYFFMFIGAIASQSDCEVAGRGVKLRARDAPPFGDPKLR